MGCRFLCLWFIFWVSLSVSTTRRFPRSGFTFLLPVLIWFTFKPKPKVVLTAAFISGFIYHIGLIGWIRHVTLPGMILASIITTTYLMPWYFLGARWVSRAATAGFTARLALIFTLSSLWVVIEWARSLFSLVSPGALYPLPSGSDRQFFNWFHLQEGGLFHSSSFFLIFA